MLNKILAITLCLVTGILIWQFYHSKNLENKLAIENQNKVALSDSVRIMKTKNGELESVKYSLAGSKDELKKLNEELSKELEKEKGKVRYITKTEIIYKKDTTLIPVTISMKDSVGTIRNDFGDDSCRTFRARTSFILSNGIIHDPKFLVEKDEFNLKLVTGLKERDKKLEIFVKSECPNITIKDIQGAVIDPNDPLIKPKKPLFTLKDALEIIGGIALGIFVNKI